MQMLLEKGANLHIANSNGLKPLHQAALYNKIEAVKLLLDFGAEKNAKIPVNAPLHGDKLPFEIVGASVNELPNAEL